MTLHTQVCSRIPDETKRVAHAALPIATPLMALRDALGIIFSDRARANRFPTVGQPVESSTWLLLVTILQPMAGRRCGPSWS